MRKLFGTDGVRGIANKDLTPELALKLGRVAAFLMKAKNKEKSSFLIGKDPRSSGDMIEAALAAGIASTGADVLLAGIVPTPAVSYLVRSMNLAGGIVVSASHNPAEYNGIKFFSRDGFKLSDEFEEKIEALIQEDPSFFNLPEGAEVGRIIITKDLCLKYKEFLKQITATRFDNLLTAVDCAHGAAYNIAPNVLAELGAQVVAFNVHPTGTNTNLACGSTNPHLLQELMKTGRFDVGLAFDGDADRLIAVDETGELVDGDQMLNIFAHFLAESDSLPSNIVTATIMSNMGLEKSLEEKGIRMIKADVGDRYVLAEMIKNGGVLGGEQSGHIVFLDYNTTGDGIISALMLLKAVKESGLKLSSLRKMMKVYPQHFINIKTHNKSVLNNEKLKKFLEEKKIETGENYRILVRPSGTEPLIRIMTQGEDSSLTNKLAEEISTEISKYI